MIGITSAYGSGISSKNPASEQEDERIKDAAQTVEIHLIEYKAVQITGIVRLTGNEPFTDLVITGNFSAQEDGSSSATATWYIAREERYKLYDLQYRTVVVEGEESIRALTFASGLPAGIRRELRNIRIISLD
ncbi:MAG: hypothetical protein FWC06_02495 [Treponema sp.]|nr:hypothetical protein [Treponema sp.]